IAQFCRERAVDIVVGVESRGFILGAPLAYELGLGFVLIRKRGKLPGEVLSVEYELEYGVDALEIHKDAIKPGMKVVLVDDLLATGGTIGAAARLVEQVGAEITGFAFLIELEALKGRENLKGYDVFTLVKYDK
ncbi:MAG: adenine phosphoribosyltransferase, partial [Limnochordia bacterium]